jgi:predicted ester cyclase
MSTEANKAIVRRFFEEFWNAGRLEVADEIVHPDYPPDNGMSGAESFKDGNLVWHRILPNIHFTIEEMLAEGDTVMVRWMARGTHMGEWKTEIGTVPATGVATTTPGTSTYHVRDGKIIWNANHIDFVGMLQQMGARLIAEDMAQ